MGWGGWSSRLEAGSAYIAQALHLTSCVCVYMWQTLTPEMMEEYAPTGAQSLLKALATVGNPLKALQRVHTHLSGLTEELRQRVAKRRADNEDELQLYHGALSDVRTQYALTLVLNDVCGLDDTCLPGETLMLMLRRYEKLDKVPVCRALDVKHEMGHSSQSRPFVCYSPRTGLLQQQARSVRHFQDRRHLRLHRVRRPAQPAVAPAVPSAVALPGDQAAGRLCRTFNSTVAWVGGLWLRLGRRRSGLGAVARVAALWLGLGRCGGMARRLVLNARRCVFHRSRKSMASRRQRSDESPYASAGTSSPRSSRTLSWLPDAATATSPSSSTSTRRGAKKSRGKGGIGDAGGGGERGKQG